MRFTRQLSVLAALAVLPALAAAQRAKGAKSVSCAVRATDAWVKRQAEWFDDSKHDWTNDTLRTALLQAAGIAAPLQAPVQFGVQVAGREPALGPTADKMVAELEKLAAARGSTWPTKSVVGAAGTHAVYLLAQRDTGFARAVLHRMMEAGPAESPAVDVATFEDHLRLVWGRKQIYGTQFHVGDNGKIVLAPMEDSAHADLRREDAALPPFKVGLCLANSGK
ncbi:MAG: hypothetical protein JWM41_78 [Gemmatimonadetes bacterium]|nr:hypothetical protein [Gemmatimonadota bacterium]